MLYAIIYMIDLGLFWSTIITFIAYRCGRFGRIVPIIFFIAFVVATIILVAHEIRTAPDIDELISPDDDESEELPELHPEHLYEDDDN